MKVGEKMNVESKLNNIMEKSDGVLMTANALDQGIPKDKFYAYIRKNHLKKVSQGVYQKQGDWQDEMYLLQLQFPRAVFSHDTALYLLDMAEMEPMPLSVTVPSKYNTPALNDKAKVYYVKNDWYYIGMCEMPSPDGHTIRVYNKERTICDIIRKRKYMDAAAFNYAVNQYVISKDRNYVLLLQYARVFHIEKKLQTMMGVLF